jgi:hypothetical protein
MKDPAISTIAAGALASAALGRPQHEGHGVVTMALSSEDGSASFDT